jgi:WD40 repeat protein
MMGLKGHQSSINAVAVTPDGARIVTGAADKTVRIWDAKTFAELAELKGHQNRVQSVAVTPDGARIVTVTGDRRVEDGAAGTSMAAPPSLSTISVFAMIGAQGQRHTVADRDIRRDLKPTPLDDVAAPSVG